MEEAAHRGLNSYQSFLGRTLIQEIYICEDSQTTASRSATTGGCPPMLKLFMIGIKIKKSNHPQIPTAHGDFQNTNRPKEMGWLHLSQFETTHAARFGPPSSILIES